MRKPKRRQLGQREEVTEMSGLYSGVYMEAVLINKQVKQKDRALSLENSSGWMIIFHPPLHPVHVPGYGSSIQFLLDPHYVWAQERGRGVGGDLSVPACPTPSGCEAGGSR